MYNQPMTSPRLEDHAGHYVTLEDAHVTREGLLGEVTSEPFTGKSTDGSGSYTTTVYRTTINGTVETLTSDARVLACRDEQAQESGERSRPSS